MSSVHNIDHNIILNVDNYKHCHYLLYPPGTEYISSYIESRGGDLPSTLFVGLQAFLREYMMRPITLEDIDEAEFILREQGMHFNRDLWLGILNDHDGYLPVEIEAVPEGTVLPPHNVLVQIINTDPKYAWATSFFETALLRAVWYPTTIASISWLAKQVIRDSLERTSDNPEVLRHMLHDYGARGVSSQESGALGGMAHLINFSQSDTVPGILAAKHYYNAGNISNSGPNSEHAAFCAWGREREAEALRNMLNMYASNGVALLLTDTYDHENCVKNIIGRELKEIIQNFPGLVGVRPDSGDVVEITADTIEWLMDAYGFEVNSKGYKVLPSYIRVVQGDGVNFNVLPEIFIEMERRGLSAENALFGMGGGLLQHHNRDTMNFAQKASAICINGEWQDIFKSPKGAAFKVSKKGRLALKYENGDYSTVRRDATNPEDNVLVPVFKNGKLLKKWDFSELIESSERNYPESYYLDIVRPLREARAAKGTIKKAGAA